MLDYGYRSRCCRAPISLAKQKKNNILRSVWKCTKCHKTNIAIISREDMDYQPFVAVDSEEPQSVE